MLRTAPEFPFKTQVLLVYALCGLHNFIHQKDIADEDTIENELVNNQTNYNPSQDDSSSF